MSTRRGPEHFTAMVDGQRWRVDFDVPGRDALGPRNMTQGV